MRISKKSDPSAIAQAASETGAAATVGRMLSKTAKEMDTGALQSLHDEKKRSGWKAAQTPPGQALHKLASLSGVRSKADKVREFVNFVAGSQAVVQPQPDGSTRYTRATPNGSATLDLKFNARGNIIQARVPGATQEQHAPVPTIIDLDDHDFDVSAATAVTQGTEVASHASGSGKKPQALVPYTDKSELVRDVKADVKKGLDAARAAGKTAVVLIGENHQSIADVRIEAAAMKAVSEHHGSGAVFMIEDTAERAEIIKQSAVQTFSTYTAKDALGAEASGHDRRLDALMTSLGETRDRRTWIGHCKVALADRMGFSITGFDNNRDLSSGPYTNARETSMTTSIADQGKANPAVPIVVAMGKNHLPELRTRLGKEEGLHLIALTAIDGQTPEASDEPERAARRADLLTHPDNIRYLVPPELRDEPLKYNQLVHQLGISPPGSPGLDPRERYAPDDDFDIAELSDDFATKVTRP